MRETRIIPMGLIVPPPEPMRLSFDEVDLNELIDNIRQVGLINPITVHLEILPGEVTLDAEARGETQSPPKWSGRYVIDAGHRRYLVCRSLGWTEIKCEVETDLSVDGESVMIAENMFRASLTPLEEANRFAEIADRKDMTESKMQGIIKKPLAYIYARLDMLKGDPKISEAVHRGDINIAVARELNKVNRGFYERAGTEYTEAEWATIDHNTTQHRRYLLQLACDTGTTAKQAHSWIVQWEIQEGFRAPQPAPQIMPAPVESLNPYTLQCALCGQFDRPYDLEMVPICRAELRVLKSQIGAAAAGGDS